MKLFNFQKEREFAHEIASDIMKRYPPDLNRASGRQVSAAKLTRILEDACQRATAFQHENRLGWLRRAKLCNDFRWALQDAGYDKAFVDLSVEAMVVHLTRGN